MVAARAPVLKVLGVEPVLRCGRDVRVGGVFIGVRAVAQPPLRRAERRGRAVADPCVKEAPGPAARGVSRRSRTRSASSPASGSAPSTAGRRRATVAGEVVDAVAAQRTKDLRLRRLRPGHLLARSERGPHAVGFPRASGIGATSVRSGAATVSTDPASAVAASRRHAAVALAFGATLSSSASTA